MKILKYITLVLVTVISFSSCENDDGGQRQPTKPYSHTVIMFMPWAGNASGANTLYDDILENIRTIEHKIQANGTMNGTRLFICLSTTPTYGELIEVVYDEEERLCVRRSLETYEWPTKDPVAVMINRFNRIKELSHTEKYSIIIGCHGMGWIPTQRCQTLHSRYIGGLSDDYRFTSEDLATALNYSDLHPVYILLDACYMANIETAFDLRKNCDYLIASTSELMDYGMPYGLMWNDLSSSNPNYENICKQFENFYQSYQYPYGTLSAIKLDEVDETVRLMKEVNKEYDCDMMIADGILNISDIQKLDGYSSSVFYDFGSYINNLCKDNLTLAQTVNSQLERLVPYKGKTQYIYGDIEVHGIRIKINTFSGITISDPTQSNNNQAVNLKRYTNWWKATH